MNDPELAQRKVVMTDGAQAEVASSQARSWESVSGGVVMVDDLRFEIQGFLACSC